MKYLVLFEGFKDDINKKISDAKIDYDQVVKNAKEEYQSELNICVSDIEDNYKFDKNLDSDNGLVYYDYNTWCELERMDEFFENILSVAEKVINHLGSDISINLFLFNIMSPPQYYKNYGDISSDNMEEIEKFLKDARRWYRIELQKITNEYGGAFRLWDVVNDKPLKSPTHDLTNTTSIDDTKYSFMIYSDISLG